MISRSLLLILSIIIDVSVELTVNCSYESQRNVTYDLSNLLSEIKDTLYVNGTALPNAPVFYTFNICGNITAIPNITSCWNNTRRAELPGLMNETGYCANSSFNYDGGCTQPLTSIETPVGAYEVINSTYCYRLHDGNSAPVYSLINENNPALGFQIRYTQGDFCPVGDRNREFNMTILCSSSYHIIREPNIVENPICSYSYTVRSIYGCPTQCLKDDKICNNNGECVYDASNATARCQCVDGTSGKFCENGDDESDDDGDLKNSKKTSRDKKWPRWLSILLAVLAGLLLCCVLGLLLALCLRKNKNTNDRRNYDRPQHVKLPSNEPERVPIAAPRQNNNSNL